MAELVERADPAQCAMVFVRVGEKAPTGSEYGSSRRRTCASASASHWRRTAVESRSASAPGSSAPAASTRAAR
ncbi:hypothetical protein [Streptomyces phaeochromogenes]|uniref:hypothetical protein n=1 Tax=Streptomyces phaeochromogenes TaxID=1923 RepID=UPI0027D7F4E5|nr:hypothetical protein [Streptomyces phaeochromogenes]